MHEKSVIREQSLFDTKAWYIGESIELKKLLGVGFFNHIFVSKNNLVTLYYDIDEANNFDKALNERLTEEFFDKLCDNFFMLIEQESEANSEQEVFELSVKIWPALCIFHEISNYPELATSSMLRRLVRVRASTEDFSYKLSKRINHSRYPKDYIFFKGALFNNSFEEFLKNKKIVIKT